MTIEWRGEGCFEIREAGNGVSLMTEMPSLESGLNRPRSKTDIYISVWSDLEDTLFSDRKEEQFLISSPGQYEIKGVFIKGFQSSLKNSQVKTSYLIDLEKIKIGYLGELADGDISPELAGFFEEAEVLILPVGGGEILNGEQAGKIISQIEPKIVIPCSYQIPKLKIKRDGLNVFLKEMGAEDVRPEAKVLIKKKDLDFKGMKIIPLSPI